ncbi:MAG TPA: tetratricopeptide repeat protein [Kamptonema sp.]|nr:tetratricopeptide repeat protein [Kamptonema sp.]
MIDSLKASEEGLKIVDEARRRKRWQKNALPWATVATTSQATLRRFWASCSIERHTFIAICQAVGVNWEQVAEGNNAEEIEQILPSISPISPEPEKKVRGHEQIKSFALPEKMPPVRNLVGRSQEIDTLKSQILDAETRAITITAVCLVGLAGIGKTTLASQLVRQLQAENAPFTVAAWETLRSPTGKAPRFDSIIDSLLLTLSHGEISAATTQNDYRQKTEILVRLLREKPCLLVLDNVETVLETGQARKTGYFADDCFEYKWLFKELVETEHQSKVIFTSRESFAELSEIAVRELPLKGLETEDAVNLLESHQHCLNLTTTSEELAKLAERYQGHPQALKLVSALIRNEPKFKGQVGKFLRDRQWLLINTIDGLIDEVFIRLSDLERTCLSRISVYQTAEYPLNTAGIAAQMPEVSEYELEESIIQGLRRRQLLDYDDRQESYQLHPLIQEKAHRLLLPDPKVASSESQLANRQAYRYFLSIPLKTEAEWQEIEDIKPLLITHYHACCAEDWDEAATAISVVYNFLHLGYYFQLLKNLCSQIIPLDWREGKQLVTSSEVHADILFRLGAVCRYIGELPTASDYLKQSLATARKISDPEGEALALNYLALIEKDRANYEGALEYGQESLKIAREIGERKIENNAILGIGTTHYYMGSYTLAIECYQTSLEVAREFNFLEQEEMATHDIIYIFNVLGQYSSATKYIKEYINLSRKSNNIITIRATKAYLANIYFDMKKDKIAKHYAKEALEIEEILQEKAGTEALTPLSSITHRFFEDLNESIDFFEKRYKISNKRGAKFQEAWALYQLGMTYQKLGQYDLSLDHFHRSFSIFQQRASRTYEEALSLLELAKTSLLINTVPLETIQDYCDRAEKICLKLKLPLLTEVQKFKVNLQ